ncbi:putative alkaline phosphatase [Protomyces lactucae-debilis]|uniref:Putative alkaline phosphatase n=1 Tax=Protomyces lactucae-debilis TaxID=2754530 RepID=A0A1Y2EXV8_PROLT|nr:putative alkaline phosphatase [Protomyces lactucae-debilis]ORY76327.1 putative alkaline phosphatase [Protomyces lactucae-debilis]
MKFALLAGTAVAVSLLDNLAFHSPSLLHPGLGHDVEALHERLVKRTLDENGDSYLPTLLNGNVNYTDAVNFTHGVASGDPDSNSIIFWTRIAPSVNDTDAPIALRYEVSTSPNFTSIATNGSIYTTREVDYTAKVLAKSLKPWTWYYYRFKSGNATSPIGRSKTLPAANWTGEGDSLKLNVFSCSNYPFGHFNAYGNAAKKDVDFSVHLGDYLYEYPPGEYDLGNTTDTIGRTDKPAKAITSLNDYRTRYKHYRADPDLAENHRLFGWFLTWDDHEVADNSWRESSAESSNTNVTVDGVSFDARKAAAVRAYYEYMPIRPHLLTNNLRLYRSFQIGQLADLSMLDTRQRDRDLTDLYTNTAYVTSIKDDEKRSMMGLEQETWFNDHMRSASVRNATWRVIGQQVVFSHLNYSANNQNVDAWDGYTSNRNRMLSTLASLNTSNNIILAGDSHVNWAFDLTFEKGASKDGNFNASYSDLGVEIAGTAISSPTPFGRTASQGTLRNISEGLVGLNRRLVYADTGYRGYFSMQLTRSNMTVQFFAAPDLMSRNTKEIAGPVLAFQKDGNALQRVLPSNNNATLPYGAIKNTTAVAANRASPFQNRNSTAI